MPSAGSAASSSGRSSRPPRSCGPTRRSSSRLAASGVTTVLATPTAGLFKGQSALVNVTAPLDEPQIGAVADPRRGLQVVRTPVALHVVARARSGRRPRRRLSGVAPRLDRVRPPELPRRAASAAREAALREDEDRRRPADLRPVARRDPAGARARAAGRVRGRPGARDPARAEHGEGLQPRSGHHRRARGRSGRRRPQGAATRASSTAWTSPRARARCRPTRTSRSASCARAPRRRRRRARSRRAASCSRSRRATSSSRGISCATPRARSRMACRRTPPCAR